MAKAGRCAAADQRSHAARRHLQQLADRGADRGPDLHDRPFAPR
jgi:hypothetical protein